VNFQEVFYRRFAHPMDGLPFTRTPHMWASKIAGQYHTNMRSIEIPASHPTMRIHAVDPSEPFDPFHLEMPHSIRDHPF
jgi:hypothetical protein